MILNAVSLLFLSLSLASARIGQEGRGNARRLIIRKAEKDKIPNQYIVRLSSSSVIAQQPRTTLLVNALMEQNTQGTIIHEYSHGFYGFAVSGVSESDMNAFAQNYADDILSIEEDALVHAHGHTDEWNLYVEKRIVMPVASMERDISSTFRIHIRLMLSLLNLPVTASMAVRRHLITCMIRHILEREYTFMFLM
jgi:hypothetical protein